MKAPLPHRRCVRIAGDDARCFGELCDLRAHVVALRDWLTSAPICVVFVARIADRDLAERALSARPRPRR